VPGSLYHGVPSERGPRPGLASLPSLPLLGQISSFWAVSTNFVQTQGHPCSCGADKTTPKKKVRGIAAAAKKATEAKGKVAPKETAKSAWTTSHPKFVMGKPMMTTEEPASAGVSTRGLHNYVHHPCHAQK